MCAGAGSVTVRAPTSLDLCAVVALHMYGGVEGLDRLFETLLPPRGLPGIAEA